MGEPLTVSCPCGVVFRQLQPGEKHPPLWNCKGAEDCKRRLAAGERPDKVSNG